MLSLVSVCLLQSVENQVQVMAQFYGLPMASLRAAAWRNMLSGKNGFDVSTAAGTAAGLPPLACRPLQAGFALQRGLHFARHLAVCMMHGASSSRHAQFNWCACWPSRSPPA